MKINLLLTALFLLSNETLASCDFKTAKYIKELEQPNQIKDIQITIPKSGKYIENAAKILVSKTQIIPPHLKKKFKANIRVTYSFGSCEYKANIWQNGDLKDHIQFEPGGKNIHRSLNVKLETGNILNAVRFKLLLPGTRNNLNEVLGSIILSELGYISPETFQVRTTINNFPLIMLFQEDSRKELLERNLRREGPIYEGDESILWGFEDYRDFDLEPVALSRMVNDNWFLKGKSSEYIALTSFQNLQKAYLDYSKNKDERQLHILYPNRRESNSFEEYFFTLLAMNGLHALRPHNRKYYYNVFEQLFEPIYYDGDLLLTRHLRLNDDINRMIKNHSYSNFRTFKIANLIELSNSKDMQKKFSDRVLISEQEANSFYSEAIQIIHDNFQKILDELIKLEGSRGPFSFNASDYKDYLDFVESKEIDQITINTISQIGEAYKAIDYNGKIYELNAKQVSALISDNSLFKKRAVFLGNFNEDKSKQRLQKYFSKHFKGEIIHSDSLRIDIDPDAREITLSQTNSLDWALFKGAILDRWKVNFIGSTKLLEEDSLSQRFNIYGMTGCLNFYGVKFNMSKIVAKDGGCEDSVNIINSHGEIDLLEISDAQADGLDMDFSRINIVNAKIIRSGNDCFDVSGGNYTVNTFFAKNCGDKGISVGEKSILDVKKLEINEALLGVSSKDYSLTSINNATFKKVENCLEATQKKQEFGGGLLLVGMTNCKSGYQIDASSEINIKNDI